MEKKSITFRGDPIGAVVHRLIRFCLLIARALSFCGVENGAPGGFEVAVSVISVSAVVSISVAVAFAKGAVKIEIGGKGKGVV